MNTKVKYARDAEMMDYAMKFINGVSSLTSKTLCVLFTGDDSGETAIWFRTGAAMLLGEALREFS